MMILRKNANSVTIKDGVGQVLSAAINRGEHLTKLLLASPEEIYKMREDCDYVGTPVFFALTRVAKEKTTLIFSPRADKKYEIEFIYFPHAKRV